jgi:hypothetical protein
MAKKQTGILTIPVPVDSAIAALEARLERINNEYDASIEKEEAFKKRHAAWRQKLMTIARKALLEALNNDSNVDAWARENSRGELCVYAKAATSVPVAGDLPAEPVRNWDTMPDYQYRHMVDEIQQAIRILRMTDEKTVPASTFAALSRYL